MAEIAITQGSDGTDLQVRLSGSLRTATLGQDAPALAGITAGRVVVDMTPLETIDTGGAWVLADLTRRVKASGGAVELRGARPDHLRLIAAVDRAAPVEQGIEAPPHGFVPWLARLGEGTVAFGGIFLSATSFLGMTLHRLFGSLLRPWRLRPAAIVSQMQQVGLYAVPIVSLMGFLIGVVLAFQGAAQLRQFGAEIFVVELISISILRELGILLTSIIVAGRSGSAFTASIGAMQVQEEIDAMRTLGLDPMEVLVVPRVLALLVMLPALGFIANLSGLFGGALMSWITLGVSPPMFITRLVDNTDVWHVAVGMIKAPFFAVVIGVIACWQGMQVRGSSDSVGQRTTASVVQSIFLVILLDALFSIFFAEIGV